MQSTEIIVHSRKGLAVFAWFLTGIAAFLTLLGLILAHSNLAAWLPLCFLFAFFTVFCALVAVSVAKSHLLLRGNLLTISAINKTINLDELTSVRVSAGFGLTRELIFKDKSGTSIRVNFAGYPKLGPLAVAVRPYVKPTSVKKVGAVMKVIDNLIARG